MKSFGAKGGISSFEDFECSSGNSFIQQSLSMKSVLLLPKLKVFGLQVAKD